MISILGAAERTVMIGDYWSTVDETDGTACAIWRRRQSRQCTVQLKDGLQRHRLASRLPNPSNDGTRWADTQAANEGRL
jgi:hypothetical protein